MDVKNDSGSSLEERLDAIIREHPKGATKGEIVKCLGRECWSQDIHLTLKLLEERGTVKRDSEGVRGRAVFIAVTGVER
jgi:hypothetical protein